MLLKYNRKIFYSFLAGVTLTPVLFTHLLLITNSKAVEEFNSSGLTGLFILLLASPFLILTTVFCIFWPVILFYIYEIKHEPVKPVNWERYSYITITFLAISLFTIGIDFIYSGVTNRLMFLLPNITTSYICLVLGYITYKKIKKKESNFYPIFIIIASILIVLTLTSDLYLSFIFFSL